MTEEGGVLATVFYDRIQSVGKGGDLSNLLGLATAHELGHLLLGSKAHTEKGIMQPRWTRKHLRQDGNDTSSFNAASNGSRAAKLAMDPFRAWAACCKACGFWEAMACRMRNNFPGQSARNIPDQLAKQPHIAIDLRQEGPSIENVAERASSGVRRSRPDDVNTMSSTIVFSLSG